MGGPHYIRKSVTLTTDGSGDAIGFIPSPPDPLNPLNGEVRGIIYDADDFDATADFTITAEETGIGIWTESDVSASKTVHPLVPGSSQLGAPLVYAAGGSPVPAGPPILAHERLKIVVAQGGDTKTGTFTILLAG